MKMPVLPKFTLPVFLLSLSFSGSSTLRGDDPDISRGAALYAGKCAVCHGEKGQGGTEQYAEPLSGDASRKELAKLIAETMPEDDPGSCVGQDAEAVAEFVHEQFYGDAAQVRNRPARIGLTRLTALQLRQSLADLYSQFRGTPEATKDRGLSGTYFDGPQWKKDKKKIERVDPTLQFDFGRTAPGEGIDPKSFFINWEGGVLANTTGRYEIIVRSTCSFVMDFGRQERELINNHVQSGDQTEFRRSVVLTAGRVYPLKIDFVQRERKTEQPPASISLSWIPPNGTEQLIPTRNLVTHGATPTFSVEAELPPDDRSYGFERGIAINRQWDDSTTAASLEFAQAAAQELWPDFRQKKKDEPDENRKHLRAFLERIVETAFRRELNDELRKRYIDDQVDASEDDAEAIQRSLLVSLKSPYFLYPLADQDQSRSARMVNRLTLTLFDSLPSSEWLVKKIRKGQTENEDTIRGMAREFMKDYRAQAKLRDMLHEWLNTKRFVDITKSESLFVGFDRDVVSDLRDSLDAFLDEVVESEASDYRQLFLADWTFTTERLAKFYGESWLPAEKEGASLRRSVADPNHRFGVLTHPYMMSGMSYYETTSPIHRGVFLIRYVMGRTLRPPNEAFTPLSPDLHPDLTTRERVSLQTSPDNCQACHTKINGLGFALENYDAVGRFQTEEKSKPLDPSGKYLDRHGKDYSFGGPRELAEYIVSSDDAHRAFVSRAFLHFVKQPIAAYGPSTLDVLTEQFRTNHFNIRELIVSIAVIATVQDPSIPK